MENIVVFDVKIITDPSKLARRRLWCSLSGRFSQPTLRKATQTLVDEEDQPGILVGDSLFIEHWDISPRLVHTTKLGSEDEKHAQNARR